MKVEIEAPPDPSRSTPGSRAGLARPRETKHLELVLPGSLNAALRCSIADERAVQG